MSVKLSLEVSDDLNQTLERLAESTHASKSDVLRRAISLMEVAVDAKKQGQSLGVVQGDVVKTRIVGI
jgi:predicted transcriptional regulator